MDVWILVAYFSIYPHLVISSIVTIKSGSIRGNDFGSYHEFYSIPFATPPVGELRWQKPLPEQPWKFVRDARIPSHQCRTLCIFQAKNYIF